MDVKTLVFGLILFLIPGNFLQAQESQLEVVTVRWNFNDVGYLDYTNLLSIKILNSSPLKAFQGKLSLLTETRTSLAKIAVQEVTLTPRSSRWVQFSVLVDDSFSGLELNWGPSFDEQATIGPPIPGKLSRVFLADEQRKTNLNSLFPVFFTGLWPEDVTQINGLQSVLLDEIPNWNSKQVRAFRDWFRLGGTLFHFKNFETGKALNLKKLLASVQNEELCLGQVVAIDDFITKISPKAFKQKYPIQQKEKPSFVGLTNFGGDFDNSVIRRLEALIPPPRLSWWSALLLSLIYLSLIGPLSYFLSRKIKSVVKTYLIFILILVACSFLASVLSSQNQSQPERLFSLSYVRPLTKSRALFRQWNLTFVHSSRNQSFAYDAENAHFQQLHDKITANKFDRNVNSFNLPLYLFTSDSFKAEGVFNENFDFSIEYEPTSRSHSPSISFNQSHEISQVFVIDGAFSGELQLNRETREWTGDLSGDPGSVLGEDLSNGAWYHLFRRRYRSRWSRRGVQEQATVLPDKLDKAVVLKAVYESRNGNLANDDDYIHVFAVMPAPVGLKPTTWTGDIISSTVVHRRIRRKGN